MFSASGRPEVQEIRVWAKEELKLIKASALGNAADYRLRHPFATGFAYLSGFCIFRVFSYCTFPYCCAVPNLLFFVVALISFLRDTTRSRPCSIPRPCLTGRISHSSHIRRPRLGIGVR